MGSFTYILLAKDSYDGVKAFVARRLEIIMDTDWIFIQSHIKRDQLWKSMNEIG
jgi:hypothetical protein